ncbi:unnamed protein product, partial [Mesorhabditis spiculigera]
MTDQTQGSFTVVKSPPDIEKDHIIDFAEEVYVTIGADGHVISTEKPLAAIERVFSHYPGNLPEKVSQLTKTPKIEEELELAYNQDGQFRIKSVLLYNPGVQGYQTNCILGCSQLCVVCDRVIEKGEMFLNFPKCLDKRRVWGGILGFEYKDMLRVKNSKKMSELPICTDHFSEECFRQFEFNKTAIEAFGVPKGTSQKKLPVIMKPWSCTVCKFNSYSVEVTQKHMLSHGSDGELFIGNRGVACPFCQKCNYVYKTGPGLVRHLSDPPLKHGLLKKIHDDAKLHCRSAHLEPALNWESWTKENVCLAYYGCIPKELGSPNKVVAVPPVSPLKPAKRLAPEIIASASCTPQKVPHIQAQPSVSYVAPLVLPVHDQGVYEQSRENEDGARSTLSRNGLPKNYQFVHSAQDLGLTQLQQRQADSIEARIRLFGAEEPEELPTGYLHVETTDGSRLVRARRNAIPILRRHAYQEP